MSQLAGILYFDSRPVSAGDHDQVVSALSRDPGVPTLSTGPGLLMGAGSASQSGCSLPELDNVCTLDGRLDNVKDLPNRYYRHTPPVPADYGLSVYETSGTKGFHALIGDWSLAIWDAADRSIVLASDYAGIRPLYYHHSPDRLIWASSLEHLVLWTGIRELDEDFVSDFLTRGLSGDRTPYRGIYPVPSGASIRFSRGRTAVARYWRFPIDRRIRYSEDSEYEEHLRALFAEAVTVRLVTDRPVCAELSGGLDSSSVVGMANRLIRSSALPVPQLISFTYRFPGSTDEKFYRAVETACGISGEYLDTGEYPPVAPHCAGFSEPCLWAPRFLEVARRMGAIGSQTFLTGQMGDLIMGNWVDDTEQAADLVREGRYADSVREALAWSRARQMPVYSILWRALAHGSGARQLRANPARPSSLWSCLDADFRERVRSRDRALAPPDWIKEAPPSLLKRLIGLNGVLDSRLLRCPEPLQAFSYSHPFSHRPLVEFMLGIPAHQVCRPGEPRRLQKRALAGILPEPVWRRRSKSNYEAMYARALRNCAVAFLEDIDDMRLVQAGYLDRDGILLRLLRLTQGMEKESSQLRPAILLECWLRQRDRRAGESPVRSK